MRAALHPFELGLQRVVADVQVKGPEQSCRLRAWTACGQTVAVERCAATRDEAVARATDSLTRALERMPAGPGSLPSAQTERPNRQKLHAVAAPVSRPGDRGGPDLTSRVLLVLHDLDPRGASLQWAAAMQEALRAELDVCRVLPDVKPTASLPSGRDWLEATRRSLSASRDTRSWCARRMPHATLAERVLEGMRDYPRQAAAVAQQRGVDWIVIPAHAGCGAAAAAIARASGRPVLVARESTTRYTLLVATELERDNYPVLENAARLAVALHAPVLAFHDVRSASSLDALAPQVDTLAEQWTNIQEALQHSAHRCPPELDVLLACSGDRVNGLLQHARREDAEMILVSLPAEGSPHSDAFASAVADDALRSVLIVPSLEPANQRRPLDAADVSAEPWNPSITQVRRVASVRATAPVSGERRRGARET
jgi:hypothetical protein